MSLTSPTVQPTSPEIAPPSSTTHHSQALTTTTSRAQPHTLASPIALPPTLPSPVVDDHVIATHLERICRPTWWLKDYPHQSHMAHDNLYAFEGLTDLDESMTLREALAHLG